MIVSEDNTALDVLTETAMRAQGFRRFTLHDRENAVVEEFFVQETRRGINLWYRDSGNYKRMLLSPLAYEKSADLEQDCLTMGIAPIASGESLRKNGFKSFVGYDRQDENRVVGGYLISLVDDMLLFFKPEGERYAIHARIPFSSLPAADQDKLGTYLR